jgi:hypothetical protein
MAWGRLMMNLAPKMAAPGAKGQGSAKGQKPSKEAKKAPKPAWRVVCNTIQRKIASICTQRRHPIGGSRKE